MPLPRLVPNAAQARLDTLTVVDLAVFDATLIPSTLATDVDALAGEIDDGIATGYARITGVAVAWNPTTQRLDLDDPNPSFDLDGAANVTYLVAYDPTDDYVVSFLPFAGGPMPGYDGFTVELSDGIAGRGNEWPLQTAIAGLDGRVTALESAPPGGGIQSVQAGTNVTVDNTDPANPVISTTGGSTPPPSPTVWLTTGSHYIDRDRVWLGGVVMHDSSGGGTIGTLPEGARPASNRSILAQVVNDAAGTPEMIPVQVAVQTSGAVDVVPVPPAMLTGTVGVFLNGLSFRIEDP